MNFHQKRLNGFAKQLEDINHTLSGINNNANLNTLSVDQVIALEDKRSLQKR